MIQGRSHIGRRLLRDKGSLFGLIVIGLSIIVAVVAYFIAPDPSPNANRIIVEIGGRKPGFSQDFLLLPRQRPRTAVSFLGRLAGGREDVFDYIPINSSVVQGDSLIIQKFVDEGVEERRAILARAPHEIRRLTFWLGTDKYGRDILSRLLIGVRVSLAVGMVTVLLSLSVGVLLGALAGYFRGRIDEVILWLVNVIWSIPTLLLVFAIMLVLGKGFWQIFIAIGLTLWVNVARIVRGQVLAMREREFVEAARALGYSHRRILFRHILPNVMGPVWVVAASNFASAIVIEAGLSFLGVGVQPPQPSWGLMIKENYNFIITHNPMLALAPGIAIMLLVLAFNLLGNGLRDALQTTP
ncbi:MAG: ABC transporter permease [Bacteroidetes bacterium]|nr:ABC transporter permease [Bacteroidota bacterium]